jgi:uncharacterized protein (DUF697 family)
MGVLALASRGAKVVRPIVDAVRAADALSQTGGHIAILPGDPALTARARRILGTTGNQPDEDALALLVLAADTEAEAGLADLERRRRRGAGALAVVTGDEAQRRAQERRLLAGHRLELSDVRHIPSLAGEGEQELVDAVVDALGDEAVAAGRNTPGLRPTVGRRLVREAARQSAAIGALPAVGVDMPVLALLQVRLVAQLAALHDRPFGAERALDALAVVGAGFGWRALGRSAVALVPGVGWAARGAVAYGATRAVGEAALARLAAGHDLIEGVPIDSVRPLIDRVGARLGR